MSAILTPVGLLLIILAGYLFKRFGLLGQKDYRVLQTAEFNIVLPGAIVYSFATNPHDISLLLISVFAFLFAFIPVVFIFLATRKRNVTDRAFLMLTVPASISVVFLSRSSSHSGARARWCRLRCSISATA